jgi:hypothetical protein
VVLSWGRVIFRPLAGRLLVGAGWLSLFNGYWTFSEASEILWGSVLDSSIKR